jgi:hypothetical protein
MAEAQEGLWMSAKERDRLKVLHEGRKRHIPQKQAGVELGISVRWVRTLVKRLLREGDNALRHRLRGRPSNRHPLPLVPSRLQQAELSILRRSGTFYFALTCKENRVILAPASRLLSRGHLALARLGHETKAR